MYGITELLQKLIPKKITDFIISIIEIVNSYMDNITKPIYYFIVYFIYLYYILLFIGVYYINPNYIHIASQSLELLVCIFLILRFNPLRQAKLGDFDQNLIFVSGLILLANLGITNFFVHFLEKETSLFAPSSVSDYYEKTTAERYM